MKTIKQLADEIGVSKTAIRKKIDDEFRAKYVQDNGGTLYVLPEGCEMLKTRFHKPAETAENVSTNAENKFAETSTNAENLVTKQLVDMLQQQLVIKDKQIADLNARLSETTAALTETQKSLQAAQALHAGTIKTQLIGDGETVEAETGARKPAETILKTEETENNKGFIWRLFHGKRS